MMGLMESDQFRSLISIETVHEALEDFIQLHFPGESYDVRRILAGIFNSQINIG